MTNKLKEANKELKSAFDDFEKHLNSLENDHFVFYCNYNEKYVKIHRSDCKLLDYNKKILDDNHFWSPEIKSLDGCKKMLDEFLRIRDFYAKPLGINECEHCLRIDRK